MSPEVAVIKHYQIVSCLGQGGFGKVFEAWDSKLQRSVAIKCLNADGVLSPATDLLREARMAASLSHPAFVKIHALEDDDNSLAIVMELIKGETLKQVITSDQPDITQSIKIIRQIAGAMQQAHDFGLTHGDLKPSNIMLEPSGVIRILDFGLASKADTQATTSMLQQDPQGTIAYMAPERLLGAPLASSNDIYALGVIFYELLNGQRPFAELSGLALAAALVQSSSDQWNYSRELSPTLIYLIRRMTAKQPAYRLPSMTALLIELDNVENGISTKSISGQLDEVIPEQENIESLYLPHQKQLRSKQLKSAILFSVLVIASVIFGGWLTRNYLWRFEAVVPRYSESQEMKLGMDALEQWDKPGSLDAAIKHFTNLAEQNPENAAAIAGLSIAYTFRYQGDKEDEVWLQKADASAQQALMLNDQIALSHIAQGRVQDLQRKSELALQSLNNALNLDPGNKLGWYAKSATLIAANRLDEAKAWLDSGIKRFPQQRMFIDALGEVFFKQGKYREAENAFRSSIAMEPDAVIPYANLNVVLLHQNRIDEALQVLQQGLQVHPSFNLYTNLGNVLFLQKDYVAAAKAFELAVSPDKGNPNSYVGWANYADALLWMPGRSNDARNAYKRAKKLLNIQLLRNQNDATLISRMGLYSARTGEKTDAINFSTRAVELEPDNPAIRFRAGLAFELLGERQRALSEITKAKAIGYPINLIESEPDLVALRRDAAYQ